MVEREEKKTVKIMVFTEDCFVLLQYERAEREETFLSLTLKRAEIRPLPSEESSGRSVDPMFPVPIVWNGGVRSLLHYIQNSSPYVTSTFRL